MTWSTDTIGDLTDQRAVITGVTGGLGLHTALELARHGAELVVTARDDKRADDALSRLRADTPGAKVSVVALDLASLSDAQRAAAEVVATTDRVDILINNAGIMMTPESTTADGFELQMGTNHLGHFAWTAALWPLLVASSARLVTVASNAHRFVNDIDLDVLTPEGSDSKYRGWRAYGASKLANLMFALELDRRTKAADVSVESVAAHPGYASTNITKTGPTAGGSTLSASGLHQVSRILGQSAHAGTWPLLQAATDPSLVGGEYIGPGGFQQMRGKPRRVGMSKAARDQDLASKLWAASEKATGMEFTV